MADPELTGIKPGCRASLAMTTAFLILGLRVSAWGHNFSQREGVLPVEIIRVLEEQILAKGPDQTLLFASQQIRVKERGEEAFVLI